MSCPQTYSCNATYQLIHHQYVFEANTDVAGTGVILAFLITGWLSFIVSLWGYTFLPTQPPDSQKLLDTILLRLGSHLTQHLKVLIPNNLLHAPSHAPPSSSSTRLRSSILAFASMLGDTQLITGTAILVAAFVQYCTLSGYHFRIVTLFSLLALSTLQSTASMCVAHYRSSGLLRLWRLGWFCAFIALCLLANIIYAALDYDADWMPFRCYFDFLLGRSGYPPGRSLGLDIDVLWAGLVIFGCIWTSLRILYFMIPGLRPIFLPIITGFRIPTYLYLFLHRSLHSLPPILRSLLLLPLSTLSFITLTIYTLIHSRIVDVARAFSFLIMGTVRIPALKSTVAPLITGSENDWGFGQILPIMLLGLPLGSLIEAWQRSKDVPISDLTTSAGGEGAETQPIRVVTTALEEAKGCDARRKRGDCEMATLVLEQSEKSVGMLVAVPKQAVVRDCSGATTMASPVLSDQSPNASQESFMTDSEAGKKARSPSATDRLTLSQEVDAWEQKFLTSGYFHAWLLLLLGAFVSGLPWLASVGYSI